MLEKREATISEVEPIRITMNKIIKNIKTQEIKRREIPKKEKVNKNNQVLNNFSIGSCAPAPLWDMISLFGRFYPEKYILHKIENNLQLFEKLKKNKFIKLL